MDTSIASAFGELLAHNQFVSGGAVLMAVGGAATFARRLPLAVYELLKRRFVLSVEVASTDKAYTWFRHWIDSHPAVRGSRRLVLSTQSGQEEDEPAVGGMPRVLLTPAPGVHLLRHRGKWICLSIRREKAEGGRSAKGPHETMVLQTLGGDRAAVMGLIEEAYQACESATAGVRVQAIKWEGWRPIALKPLRPLSSVVLPEGELERLIADVRTFLESQAWYAQVGISWKRGYLLYGEPGNGKSSLVLAIASHINAQIHYLNLANAEVNDESLPSLLAEVPRGNIVLIEEIDTLFEQRTSKAKEGGSRLTFGGLLNALDGPTAQEGLLVFLTTNHIEKLDPALIRPGRVDMRLHIGNATPHQAQRLFGHFYPQAAPALAALAAARLPSGCISMATLQEHFMRYRDDPEGALESPPFQRTTSQAAADPLRPHHFLRSTRSCPETSPRGDGTGLNSIRGVLAVSERGTDIKTFTRVYNRTSIYHAGGSRPEREATYWF